MYEFFAGNEIVVVGKLRRRPASDVVLGTVSAKSKNGTVRLTAKSVAGVHQCIPAPWPNMPNFR